MKLKLIQAFDLEVNMFVQGHPGWWPVAEVRGLRGWPGVDRLIVKWTQDHGSPYGTNYNLTDWILVGIPDD